MTLQEIGGYFELEDYGGGPYHDDAIALDSARSCLTYLIELRAIKCISLPDFMCDAVAEVCARAGVTLQVYEVRDNFLPAYDFSLGREGWLYLADYYGRLRDEDVAAAMEFAHGRVVVDEVQGFFRKPWNAADTIYTCRKFFGVPDGAYLATRDGARLDRTLPDGSSAGRAAHLLGRCEGSASSHYNEYLAAEDEIGARGPEVMSEVTRRLLSGINYGSVKVRREDNYAILDGLLGGVNLLESISPAGPYMYPLLVDDAGDMRRGLAARGIYIPTLWPNVVEQCSSSSFAYRYANNILPLPVDQRYGEAEMRHVAKEVGNLLRKKG